MATTPTSFPNLIRVVPFSGSQWGFEYPRIDGRVHELFHEALELLDAGEYVKAEKELRVILEGFPEFIDVYHHIAIILDSTSRHSQARKLWETAVQIGRDAFPDTFKAGRHRLPWEFLDNRPFLRAYHAWGLEILEEGDAKGALAVFEEILKMNPNDNQGVRVLALDCHFLLGKPAKALELCNRFRDDSMAEILYGRALALLQLGREVEARTALAEAVETWPLVAAELLKKSHRIPRAGADYAAFSRKAQAYDYWEMSGQHWAETAGAHLLVAEVLVRGRGSRSK